MNPFSFFDIYDNCDCYVDVYDGLGTRLILPSIKKQEESYKKDNFALDEAL